MPVSVFAMFVFAICTWLSAGLVEPVMRDFAVEAGLHTWVFIAVPGLLAMLASLVFFRTAADRVSTVEQSISRALAVALTTWLALAALISFAWCPGYRALDCTSDVLLVTGVIGGGPLLAASLVAGFVVGLVFKRRVAWLSYAHAAPPAPVDPLDAQ